MCLVEFTLPLEDLRERLARFPWGPEEGAAVVLERRHLLRILDFVRSGELATDAISAWAEALESREDIVFTDEAVGEAVFVLANPDLEGQLTPPMAQNLAEKLHARR